MMYCRMMMYRMVVKGRIIQVMRFLRLLIMAIRGHASIVGVEKGIVGDWKYADGTSAPDDSGWSLYKTTVYLVRRDTNDDDD